MKNNSPICQFVKIFIKAACSCVNAVQKMDFYILQVCSGLMEESITAQLRTVKADIRDGPSLLLQVNNISTVI